MTSETKRRLGNLAAVVGITLAWVVLFMSTGCDSGGTTAPTPTAEQVVATPTATGATSPAAPATVTAPGTYEVVWGMNASWTLWNHTVETLYYTASWTDFDNQSLVRGSKGGEVASGKSSEGSFDKTCVQVDIYPLGSGKAIGFAFFDKNGRAFNPSSRPEKVKECGIQPTPQPTPTPRPTPTPTPSPSPTCKPKPSHVG